MKILWEELETYMPIPCCACPVKCTYTTMRNVRHFHNLNHVIRFLTGLNENFLVVKSQILLMDPLPSINRIFSMVIQHERQGNFIVNDDSKVLINIVDKRMQGRRKGFVQNSGPRKICAYCGKTGHTVDTCYRKHGFPPHFQKGNSSMINNACSDTRDLKEDLSTNGDISTTPSTFTHEQYEKILSLIQGSGINQHSASLANQVSTFQSGHSPSETKKSGIINISSSFNSFCIGSRIIDSGASDHICASFKTFQTFNEIKPISIRLPNGHVSIAKYTGTVVFSPGFFITNVLCVPNFSFKLISVSKLISTLNCVVSFNNSRCVI